jgi:hypothetical protein
VKGTAVGAIMLLMASPAQAEGPAAQRAMRSCIVEVLHSEELPIGPMFFHTIKATLLVTAPGAQPFQVTVQEVIPWQMPPPRRGKRVRVQCDPTTLNSSFRLFGPTERTSRDVWLMRLPSL